MRLPLAVAIAFGVAVLTPDPAARSLSPTRAEAAVSLEMSLGDLVAASKLVVVGTPLDHRAVWEDDDSARGRRIVTYTRVRVDRAIDGAAKSGDEVWVRSLGGHVGDIGQRVDGEALLVTGVQAILFLQPRGDGTQAIAGMAQGHYPIVASNGAPPRLVPSPTVGMLLPRAGSTAVAAGRVLVGKTLDEASALIVAERAAHAR